MAPWSTFWDRNFFAESLPALEPFVSDNFTRGAVSGLGLVNVWAALAELAALLARWRDRAAVAGHSRLDAPTTDAVE